MHKNINENTRKISKRNKECNLIAKRIKFDKGRASGVKRQETPDERYRNVMATYVWERKYKSTDLSTMYYLGLLYSYLIICPSIVVSLSYIYSIYYKLEIFFCFRSSTGRTVNLTWIEGRYDAQEGQGLQKWRLRPSWHRRWKRVMSQARGWSCDRMRMLTALAGRCRATEFSFLR